MMSRQKRIDINDWNAYTTVYGPVPSWRVGASLGIDPICETSICSFNCIYCQLGNIVEVTMKRREFIPTEKVIQDLEASRWREAEVVTFSGSGEPTLATNIKEINAGIKRITGLPTLLLTNGTLLHLKEVQDEVSDIDKIYFKLDAATPETFQRMNRPAPGVTFDNTLQGAKTFRKQYRGYFALQCMFTPANLKEAKALASIANEIAPDEIQLNTPKRPYPTSGWDLAARGSHTTQDYPAIQLQTISRQEADEIERLLGELTSASIVSVYQPD